MEIPVPPEYQNLNQQISPNVPQKNIYKILFFIFFGLFLVVFSVFATLFFTQKRIQTKISTSEVTDTSNLPVSKLTITPSSSNIPNDWISFTSKNLGFSLKIPPNYYVKEKDTVVISTWDQTTDKYKNLEGFPDNEAYIDIGFGPIAGYNELLETFKSNITSKRDVLLNDGNKAKLITVYDPKRDEYIHLGYIEHNNSVLSFLFKCNETSEQSKQDQFISNFTKIVQSTEFKQ